jgi:hypothetical protein
MEFLVVKLKKTTFDNELCLCFSFFNFFKNQSYNPWDDTVLVLCQTNCVSRTHSPRLSWSSLTICQDSGIKTQKASQYKVFYASVKNIFLSTILSKCCIIGKHFIGSNSYSIVLWKSPHYLLFKLFLLY